MNPAYFETRFRTDGTIVRWPAEFVIITAYATTGESWTAERNDSSGRALESELVSREVWFERLTGYSPSTGHAEPGWAAELPLDEARELGIRYRQDAIYHVIDDRLSVTHCDVGRELVFVGSFHDRLDPGDR